MQDYDFSESLNRTVKDLLEVQRTKADTIATLTKTRVHILESLTLVDSILEVMEKDENEHGKFS